MSKAEEIAAAFDRVDALLLAATAAAPAVALLAARAAERGITETKLANHLHQPHGVEVGDEAGACRHCRPQHRPGRRGR